MKKMKSILCLVLALVMMFALAACGGSKTEAPAATGSEPAAPAASSSEPAAPAASGDEPAPAASAAPETLRIGIVNNLGRFLAGISPAENFTACDAVFDTIFKTDGETKAIYSDILESYEWTDEHTFVMTMKDNVYFSNGEQATGEDLLFSYTNHPERGSNYVNDFGIIWDECSADGQTVTMKFENPYPLFVNTMIYLVDKSWSQEVGWDSLDWYNCPVGSGPYKVSEYVTDDHMVLTAREDYWNKDAYGEFVIKEIYYKNYSDRATMEMDLELGNIDLCTLTSTDYERWMNEGSDQYGCALVSTGAVCFFNYGFLPNPMWQDENLRRAIAYGCDWYQLGELAYGDVYVPAKSCVPASSSEFIETGMYEYDLDLAKQYLAAAGYEPGELTIHTYMMEDPFYHTLCEAFQFYMQELGVNVDLEFGDVSSSIANWVDINSGIDFGFFFAVMGSPSGNIRAGLWNAADLNGVKWGYIDDDEFLEEFKASMYAFTEEEKIEHSKKAQQIAYDKCLMCNIGEVSMTLGYNAKVFTEQQVQKSYISSDNFQVSRMAFSSWWA